MRHFEILHTDKNKITITRDRITLRIHVLGKMKDIPLDDLQNFCNLINENVFHKNTLRGKITLKDGLLKSKVLIKPEYGRDGFTLIYNLQTKQLNVFEIKDTK